MKPGPWIQPLAWQLRRRWEALFLIAIECLLIFQVFFFQVNIHELSDLSQSVATFAAINAFVFNIYGPVVAIVMNILIVLAAVKSPEARWSRSIYDTFGIYFITRTAMQLIGLNVLVFDTTSSRFLLISQLIFFLPTLLLIWGWIYWRLDRLAQSRGRVLFRLDHEHERPRVIDYFVASFSTVFSASIPGIKGASARARMLILLHGFMIYDVMGLTLSRAVALVQR